MFEFVFSSENESEQFQTYLESFTYRSNQQLTCARTEHVCWITSPVNEEQKIFLVADVLAHYIMDKKEWYFLEQLAERKFSGLSDEERLQIINYALQLLDEGYELHVTPDRRNLLMLGFMRYLTNHSRLALSGFIQFRMIGYYYLLEMYLDYAKVEYDRELRYQETVCALRQVVRNDHRTLKEVHVYWEKNSYQLYDQHGNRLDEHELFLHMKHTLYPLQEAFRHAILIAILVSVVPEKVFVYDYHYRYTSDWLPLQLIFEDRCEIV
ncbi:MAG: sporulation protein YtxC [Bacilli bacterium]